MPQYWTLDTEDKRKNFNAHLANMILAGKAPTVQFVEKVRSEPQANAMWLWCEMCANYLNDAGLDMRAVLREDIPIDWSKDSFMNKVWRKVQEAMGKHSTRDLSTTEVNAIYETITRHIAESKGVTLPPFPSRMNVPAEPYKETDNG